MHHKPQLQDCPRTFPRESRSLRLSADKEARIHAAPRLRSLLFKGRTEQGGEDSSRIGCPEQAESKRWTSPTSWADTGNLTLGQKKMDKAMANSSDCWGKSKMESSLHSYNNLVIYCKFQGVCLGGYRWEGLNGMIKRVANRAQHTLSGLKKDIFWGCCLSPVRLALPWKPLGKMFRQDKAMCSFSTTERLKEA